MAPTLCKFYSPKRAICLTYVDGQIQLFLTIRHVPIALP